MPKALCMSGMVVAILIVVLFLVDLVAPASYAPFRNASRFMDIMMLLAGIGLGAISWLTYREQD